MSYPWWLITLAVFGGLAIVSVFISLFTSLGRRPTELVTTRVPSVREDAFLQAMSGTVNAPLTKGGSATMLNNGDAFFPAMLEAFAAAKQTIDFFVYIWEPGEASGLIANALAERARAGVQVRVLLDGLGGIRAPEEDIDLMCKAGVKVNRFRPARFGKLTRFYKRNHRRAIIIDGTTAFTGGAAVGDKWLGNAQDEKHWRDYMVKLTGCLAANLQSAFSEPWAYVCGEILVGSEYYPESFDPNDNPESRHVHIVSSPSSEEHPLRLSFMLTFLAAREKLYITTSYFVPDKHTRKAVMDRARAGVDVRILVPNEHTDAKPIRHAGRSYYDELLEAGVRIYEYQPTMIHCKTVVVDGVWSVIGSANMDIRSKELNQENVIGILDETFAKQVEQTFLQDLRSAHEYKLDEWRRRGVRDRIKERIWVTFAEQY